MHTRLSHLNVLAAANNWPTEFDASLAFERAELRQLLALWREKAAGSVPPRSAFDIRSMKPFATNFWLVQREREGDDTQYRFRLFGSALQFLFGEHTGRSLDDMVTAELLPSWRASYDAVLEERLPLRITQLFQIAPDQFLRAEVLAAPLADASGRVEMLLGATYVSHNDAVHSPFEHPSALHGVPGIFAAATAMGPPAHERSESE